MATTPSGPLSAEQLEWLVGLVGGSSVATEPAEAVDRIRALEALKAAAAAAQAAQTAAFVTARKAEQDAAGVPSDRVGQGIAAEVALARRCSPFHARRYVGWARILTEELPETFARLARGSTTEWRAMLVARETAWLSRDHRLEVDGQVAPRLDELGDAGTEREVKRLAYRLDPHGYVDRVRGAAADRCVSLRPAPDAMARLSALLPVAQGVAAIAALRAAADSGVAAGDGRGRGQIMADTLVERLTGQDRADHVPVTVNLVMTDQSFLAAGPEPDEPPTVHDYGPVPSAIARDLIARGVDVGPDSESGVWLRRLYTRPSDARLLTMETERRLFTRAQRTFIGLRDQVCRTPYCGAPVRHADHADAAADGGTTSLSNAQGLCEACNYAKQALGWHAEATDDGDIVTSTPTGHVYRSRLPQLTPRPREPVLQALPRAG